jgi:hypothetical protein
MVKTTSKGDSRKITFGTRKRGKARKSYNKHDHTGRNPRKKQHHSLFD